MMGHVMSVSLLPPPVNFERVMEEKLVEMDSRYQAMFVQVLSHVMKTQSQPPEPSSPDTEMGWDQFEAPPRNPRLVQMITQAWEKHRRDQLRRCGRLWLWR